MRQVIIVIEMAAVVSVAAGFVLGAERLILAGGALFIVDTLIGFLYEVAKWWSDG